MVLKKRCNIEIKFDHDKDRKIFTSGSVISGAAVVSANHDIAVTALEISFSGVVTIALSSQHEFRTVKHQFLLLKMPALDEYLPETRILKAQATYTIPFDFTVPHRLSINACNHKCGHPHVIERHVRLPPTVGCWTKNDKSPSAARIVYSIRAMIARQDIGKTVTDQACQAVIVLPGLPEDPPLDLSPTGNSNGSVKTKDIRMRRFKAHVGSLTVSTRQPHAIILTADGCDAVGSWAHVDFEFVPFGPDVLPPQVHVKSVKIRSVTLYTTTPFSQIPQSSESTRDRAAETFRHCYTHPILHLSQEVANWVPQYVRQDRDSSSRSSSATAPQIPNLAHGEAKHSAQETGPPAKYTTSLHIPFTLRSKGGTFFPFFLPTFHSCFMSRIYVLQLNFAAGASNSSMELVVPLHICVEQICDPDDGELPTFESVMAQDEQPRHGPLYTASRMETRACMTGGVLPPEYEARGHSL